jgi:hypothetical protein
MPARLGIHILGPRYGESIILELPDGGIGVIDCFAAGLTPHPVVGFLVSRFPKLSKLRFLGVTHPHADHCYRIAEILEKFGTEEVWAFHPFPTGQILNYYTALAKFGTRDAVEEALGLTVGSIATSLLQFRERIHRPIQSRQMKFRSFAGGHNDAVFCGDRVRISHLTPVAQSQFRYAASLETAAERIFKDGLELRPVADLQEPKHNRASGSILIQFGTTRILLMADAEEELWEDWLATNPPVELCRPVHFLKIAHHGSLNGYHPRVYAAIADRRQTIGVLTPFNQGKVHLPNASGVQAIRSHVRALYCTNRLSAASTSGLQWDSVASRPMPRLPARWAYAITRHPALANLLESSATERAPVTSSTPSIPAEWVQDAQKSPELWRLFRHDVCLPTPNSPQAEAHRISAYYDDRGNNQSLEVSEGAGILHS